jgi:hypothetical protein
VILRGVFSFDLEAEEPLMMDLVMSRSLRLDLDVTEDDRGVKNRLNLFGVIGGGFFSIIDFRGDTATAGSGRGDECVAVSAVVGACLEA